ncbi:mucin-12-like isoform X2 [Rhipicephalus sanguineus]|uniref:mucin-12-like isoform X2 n=1 Tax=Rhipicephalus sanguineus TaxID=34632 RepID=UPI0020C24661|nr:mucin-12-like isoform X2 [Rhipicephalus sanguineus]
MQGGNIPRQIQPPSPNVLKMKSVSFERTLQRATKLAAAPSFRTIESMNPALTSPAELTKAPAAAHANETAATVLNAPPSTPTVPTQGRNIAMNIQLPSPTVEPTKIVSVEGELKRIPKPATTPSLPTIETSTPSAKPPAELPKTPSAPSTPRASAQEDNVEGKIQTPSTKLEQTKSEPSQGEPQRVTEPATATSAPTIGAFNPAVKSAADLPKAHAAGHAGNIITLLLNVPPSTPTLPTQGGHVSIKIQSPSPKAEQTNTVPIEGEINTVKEPPMAPSNPINELFTAPVKSAAELTKTSSTMHANLTAPVLNVPPSKSPVLTQKGNVAMRIHSPLPKVDQTKSVFIEGELKRIKKPETAASLPTSESLIPAVKVAAELGIKPSAVHANEISTPVLIVPPSIPKVPTQKDTAGRKIHPPLPKVEKTKSVLSDGDLKRATEHAIATPLTTIETLIPSVKSATHLPKASSAVHAQGIIGPGLNVQLSTPRVLMQGGNVAVNIPPSSSRVEQAKTVSFEGGLKIITKPATAPSISTIEARTPAVIPAAELAKTRSEMHANEIESPPLNVPPSATRIPTQGGNAAMKIQPSSEKVQLTKSAAFEGTIKTMTKPETAPSLPTTILLTPPGESAAEIRMKSSAVHANEISAPALNVPPSIPRVRTEEGNAGMKSQPPSPKVKLTKSGVFHGEIKTMTKPETASSLSTTESFPATGESAAELRMKYVVGRANKISTPVLNVPPPTLRVPTEEGNAGMKIQPPSPKVELTKSGVFEGEIKTITKPETAPSLPTTVSLTPAGKSAPQLKTKPSAVHANEISTPVLNIPPSIPRVPIEKGSAGMKLQPPSPNVEMKKSGAFEGEIKTMIKPQTAPSLPTTVSLTPAGKSAPELKIKPSAVHANEISTPVLNIPPSIPRVPIEKGSAGMKLQPPSPNVEMKKSGAFEGEIKTMIKPQTAPSLPTTVSLTPAGRSAPELKIKPSAVHANEISTPVLNIPPSIPRVPIEKGSAGIKLQPPSPNVEMKKSGAFEGEIKTMIKPQTAPSLPTTVSLTPAGRSAPELKIKPSAVHANEISTPVLNIPPSIPRVPIEKGSAGMKLQPPSPNVEMKKSGAFEGEIKTMTKPQTARSLPTTVSFTPARESAAELRMKPSAMHVNEISTPVLNVPSLITRVHTEEGNPGMKIQAPAPKIQMKKSGGFDGEIKTMIKPQTAPSLPTTASLTLAGESAAELSIKPSAVHANAISTPVLNMPPTIPRVRTEAGNVRMKIQPSSPKVQLTKSGAFEGVIKTVTKPETAPSLPTTESFPAAGESAAELRIKPSAVHANAKSTPVLVVPPSIPRVPTEEGNAGMNIQPSSTSVEMKKSVAFDGAIKTMIKPLTAPSLPTTLSLTPAGKSAAELKIEPPAVRASKISTPVLNVRPSIPRVPTEKGNAGMKIQPPSPNVEMKKSGTFEGEIKKMIKPPTAPSLPTPVSFTPAGKSAAELRMEPPAVHANKISTPVLNVPPSIPRVPTEEVRAGMKIQPPARKVQMKKSGGFDGEIKTMIKPQTAPSLPTTVSLTPAGKSAAELRMKPSAVHANAITTQVLNFPPSIPRVPREEGNARMKIQPPSQKVELKKTGAFKGEVKTMIKPQTSPSLPTTISSTPAGMYAADRRMKPSVVHANERNSPVLNVPPSIASIPTGEGNAKLKIQPRLPKVERKKIGAFEGEIKTMTKPETATSVPTTASLTPAGKSTAELRRKPYAVHANEISTPVLNVPPATLRAPAQQGNVGMKNQPPSPKLQQTTSLSFEGMIRRATEPSTTPFPSTMESLSSALKSARELPKTPSAVDAHKISTPLLNAPPLTLRVPHEGSSIAKKIPPHSRKVPKAKSASFEDLLKRTTEPAMASSLLKIEKLSHGLKSVAELPNHPSGLLVKGVITPGFNMPPTIPKVITQSGNKGVRRQLPDVMVPHRKVPAFEVEIKRTTEPSVASSQTLKSGPSIPAVVSTKEASGRLVAEVNPPGYIFPPTLLGVLRKGGNESTNMQPPSAKVLQPNNGSVKGALMGRAESAIVPSLYKTRTFIPAMKSTPEMLKERSALLVKKVIYPLVTTPKLLRNAGVEAIKVQPPSPSVSQPTPESVAASLKRSESKIHNAVTEFEIARRTPIHREESKIFSKMLPHTANIFREKAALALAIRNASPQPHAASNVLLNQRANHKVVAELATNASLLPLKKHVEANFTYHAAEAPFTSNKVGKQIHRQSPISVLFQPVNITDSQALDVVSKSRSIPQAQPHAQHAWYHIHNVRPSNDRVTSLKFLHQLAQITPSGTAVPYNSDEGDLFEATLRAISHNIGNPVETQRTLLETMKPVRGIPQLTTLNEEALSRNLDFPDVKNLLFRGNTFYNTEPQPGRNGIENYALIGTRGIRPFQQPSLVKSRALFEENPGAVFSDKLSGLSPYLPKPQTSLQPLHFIYEHMGVLPDRVPVLIKSNINVLTKQLYEFLDIKRPDGWHDYYSTLINAKLSSRLYAILPYWLSATFEYLLSQEVESSHALIIRQNPFIMKMPFIRKANRNVRGLHFPLSAPLMHVPLIPLRNIVPRRTSRESHFLPKTDVELRYAHQPTAFATLPHWYPKTFEHLLGEEVESGNDVVTRRNFMPSEQTGDKYVTGSISPLRAYLQYISRIFPKTTATRTSSASQFSGNMNLDLRNIYSSNILERQPLLPMMYPMQSPWCPRTVEHLLSQEGKNSKGLLIKRIFLPFIKNNENNLEALTSPLSSYSYYIPHI